MLVGIVDKVLAPWLEGKEYMGASDEGEAVALAAGYFKATGKRADVFMSADGLCNALNFLTSWIIPDKIEMNLIIGTGRQEPPHKVMSDMLDNLLKLIPYDDACISIDVVRL